MENRTIQNGEKLIFSVAIGIGTLNTPPTIRVTSQLKNSYYQGEVVDVQGYVNDVDNGDIVTVKYAIDGGEEMVIANNLRPMVVKNIFIHHFLFQIIYRMESISFRYGQQIAAVICQYQ